MKFKKVMTYSPKEKKVRLFRMIWAAQKKCMSFALIPVLFSWRRNGTAWRLVILGISIHHHATGSGGLFT